MAHARNNLAGNPVYFKLQESIIGEPVATGAIALPGTRVSLPFVIPKKRWSGRIVTGFLAT